MSERILHVPAQVHGRVLVEHGSSEPESLLVGFHGYGEGAEESLAAMRRIRGDHSWALAAIQALHPFYRRSDGGVVASWMTKLDREPAIVDNQLYVSRAIEAIRGELPSVRRMAFAGFSQGVAMAYRAAGASPYPVDALVVLAGDVPPDLRDGSRTIPPVLLGRGTEDEWYDAAKMRLDLEILERLGVEHEALEFEGGHDWDAAFVDRARAFLSNRLVS